MQLKIAENLEVKRLKRKSGKLKEGSDYSVESYVKNLKFSHVLAATADATEEPQRNRIEEEEFEGKIFRKWKEYEDKCYLVEILTAFQTAIQSICENVVLLDRVEFLREKQFNCAVYKVTENRISPRCHALVATKP